MEHKVKTIDVDGETVDLLVNNEGNFRARVDGQDIELSTLKALINKVRDAVRVRGKLNIEATLMEKYYGYGNTTNNTTFKNITITGKHNSNNNILYKGEDNRTNQVRGYSSNVCILKRLTPGDISYFQSLEIAQMKATKILEKWKTDHQLDVAAAITAARKSANLSSDEEG